MRSVSLSITALVLVGACHQSSDVTRAYEPPTTDDPPRSEDGSGGSTSTPRGSLQTGDIVHASRTLPPISGGTLAVGLVGSAEVAVASDPENDRIWVVEPKGQGNAGNFSLSSIALSYGDEPGRVVMSGDRAFVALRRSGQVAIVNLADATLSSRLAVCASPRGIDIDAKADLLAVACMSGELSLFKASTLEPIATHQLDRDLRDVVLRGEEILVSRFRSAEIMVVLKDGTVKDRAVPAPQQTPGVKEASLSTAEVAWRMVPTPEGALVMHQRGGTGETRVSSPGGYSGGPCGSIVRTALSEVGKGTLSSSGSGGPGLAVDVAVSKDGQVALAIASTLAPSSDNPHPSPNSKGILGNCGERPSRPLKFDGAPPVVTDPSSVPSGPTSGSSGSAPLVNSSAKVSQGVAVAFSPTSVLVTQTRAPHGVRWGDQFIPFPEQEQTEDTGHQIFHMDSGGGITCASCHPEGGDDGHVWLFETFGKRRTQPLQGGLKGSEPFHWSGDMNDFSRLMTDVFSQRMSGPAASVEQAQAVLDWINTVPALPAARLSNDEAVVRGQALFVSDEVGCASCHNGARLEGNGTVDVGTGEPLQVPPLRGLAYRAPFLHDGCAPTLRDRFGACGGGDLHGHTSQLSAEQLDDLTAYLESLLSPLRPRVPPGTSGQPGGAGVRCGDG